MLAAWPNQISQCYAGCGEDVMPGCADDGGAESGASRARLAGEAGEMVAAQNDPIWSSVLAQRR